MTKLYKITSFPRWIIFLIIAILLLVLPVFVISEYTNKGFLELLSFFSALVFGVWVFAHQHITNFLFPSLLQINTWISETYIDNPIINNLNDTLVKAQYTTIKIKNVGFTAARNIRIRIKDDENKQWIYLHRPYWNKLKEAGEEYTRIISLSKNETDDIVLGFVPNKVIWINSADNIPKDCFCLETIIEPYNQLKYIQKDKKHTFYIQISADNISSKTKKVTVDNNGYGEVRVDIN